MSEEVRSMSISLSMEDAGIDRTLAQVRRSFRTLTNDVKLVNKEFQYGEKGISDYENKVTELSSAVKIAKGNVGDLEKQYHTIGKEQGYTSSEALKLRQEWAKQKNELNFLQRNLEAATSDLKAFQKQQMIANSNWTKSGNAFSGMSKSLDSISSKLTSTGKSLTNSITKPALIAGTAIGGITAKLGFDRLVGLDSAQAKLEGLGYSTKEVGEISDQVTNAIKGGMTTMAEGTDVAAGALASGVKEGKELEHYIKLVGDAAVGANRPVSDMAMIFNRVQGQGKLMTEELNMVEEGMPGFSKAMAKHLGVSYEEFRKMVTEGQVTSKDFLTVMDDFAGGMAGAYSKSFKGMVSNTKAYIGMIGESLLSGVFEKSKDSLAEFEKLLQSPSVQKWAQKTGDKLGNAVNSISNAIGGIISWFNSLDKGTQKSIASIMKWSTLILIGIGPVLTILGKLTGALAGTFGTFGKFLGFMGKLSVESKTAGGLIKGFTNLMPKTGAVIGAVANPIGLTVVAIAALAAGLVIAYKKSETFRNIVNGAFNAIVSGLTTLWNGIKTLLTPVVNAIKEFGGELKKTFSTFWSENGPQFMQALNNIKTGFATLWNVIKPVIGAIGVGFSKSFEAIKTIVTASMPVITQIFKIGWTLIQSIIVSVWNNIKGVINGALNVIMGVIKVFSGLFTGNFKLMWSGVKQIFVGAFQFLWNLVQLWFVGKIFGVFKLGFGLIKGIVSRSLGSVRGTFTVVLKAIWIIVKSIFTNISTFMKFIFSNILKATKAIWGFIKLAVTNPTRAILTIVRSTFNILSKTVRTIFTVLSKAVKAIWTGLKNAVVATAKGMYALLKNRFELLRSILSNITRVIAKTIKSIWTSIKNTVINLAKALSDTVRAIFDKMRSLITGITTKLKNAVVNGFKGIKNNAINLTKNARDGVVNGFKAMYNKGKSWIDKLKNFLKDSVSGFKSIAKKVGNGVANGAIGGLNAMIDGINSLSNKIMSKKLIKKKIPTLSTGTGIQTDSNGLLKRGTKAIVNDKGPGNGKGPNGHKELIYRRNGKVERPIGNNKKVRLKRGDGVINGAQSQSLLPQLSTGTVMDRLFGSGAKASKKKPKDKKKWYEKAGDNIGKSWDATKDFGKDVATTTGKGIKSVMKGIGDVWDYASNPSKLINKVLGGLGIDFSGIKGAMGGFIGWGAKKLKEGMVDLVTGWFEEEGGGGGDGSSFTKFAKVTPYSPNKPVPGYPTSFNGGRHYGIDYATPSGTVLTAPTSGVVKAQSNHGGGTVARLLSGKVAQYFLHLSDILKTGRVKQGEKFAKTGNSGAWTTGPHLHYQVENPASSELTNKNTMDPEKFLSGKGGGNKAASKWAPEIRKAAKRMKVTLSSRELQGIIAQIDRESNGNAGVTQGNIGDINNRNGTPAQGLLQYVPSTFNSYKMKGHGNIKSGYDQLLAFFNNSNWRKDLPYGKSGWGPSGSRRFATGGIIRDNGLYNLAEEGHEEVVISTDPKRAADSMKLINYVANKVQGRSKGNKRPNQVKSGTNTLSNNNNAELLQALTELVAGQQEQMKKQDKQISILTEIAMKAGFNEGDVSKAQGKRAEMLAWNMGGAIT
ncbi:tape measure protein [Mammaliicoccus sciuri]|uniref:tape measure protein n=1 Tax=Mammaliicoccus sciuri TaxID=1296 RepID=UPI0028FC5D7C|nr:tape measure protein [Mammaliicoccus sciuri]MDU0266327.1 tape measure protein [Mammaliicoccus sciuri]